LNGRYVATVLNRAITLSIVDGRFIRTRGISRIPCASGARVTCLPGERDDFAPLICDLRQKRYTQSVRPFFQQAVNVAAHAPFLRQEIPFFQTLFCKHRPQQCAG
jgi:hypothetical protein